MVRFQYLLVHKTSLVFLPKKVLAKNVIFHKTIPVLANEQCMFCLCCCANQERSQKGDCGCASEKLGVPHVLSD